MSENNQDNVHGDDIRLTSRVMGELSSYGEDEQRRDQGNDPTSDQWESTVRNLTSSLRLGFQTTSENSTYSMDAKRRARLMKRLARPAGKISPYRKCLKWTRSKFTAMVRYSASNRSELMGAVGGVVALFIFGLLLAGPFSALVRNDSVAVSDEKMDSEVSSLAFITYNDFQEPSHDDKSEDKPQKSPKYAPEGGWPIMQFGVGPAPSSAPVSELSVTQDLLVAGQMDNSLGLIDESRSSMRGLSSSLDRSGSQAEKEEAPLQRETPKKVALQQGFGINPVPTSRNRAAIVPQGVQDQSLQYFDDVATGTAVEFSRPEEPGSVDGPVNISGAMPRPRTQSAPAPAPTTGPATTLESAASERGRTRLYSINNGRGGFPESNNLMEMAEGLVAEPAPADSLASDSLLSSRQLRESEITTFSSNVTSSRERADAGRENWAYRKSKGVAAKTYSGSSTSDYGGSTYANSDDYAFVPSENQEIVSNYFGRNNVRFDTSSDIDSDGVWLGQEFEVQLGDQASEMAAQVDMSVSGGARFGDDNAAGNGHQWFEGGYGGGAAGGGGGFGGRAMTEAADAGTVRKRFISSGIQRDKDSLDTISANTLHNQLPALDGWEVVERTEFSGSLFAKNNKIPADAERGTTTFATESKQDSYFFEGSDSSPDLAAIQAIETDEKYLAESLSKLGEPIAQDGFIAGKALVKEQQQLAEKLKVLEAPNQTLIEPRHESEPFPEMETSTNAVSTFSLNVNDASFQLARSALDRGQLPDKLQIRSEEFVNALNYYDPKPSADDAVAIHYDRAIHPFESERQVLRIGVQTAAEGLDNTQPMNLVVVLDTSGSMERPDRSEIAGNILRTIATELKASDRISVVGFARRATLWADGIPGGNPDSFMDIVQGIRPDGGTNIELALNLAYEKALEHFVPGGRNRVLLLTDGAANLGEVNPARLRDLAEARRKQGVALDAFGIGWEGHDDNLLESLTRNSDGNYGFLSDPYEAGEYFRSRWFGAVEVAAKDVKVQVEFNPARVLRYRQVGYLKHRLTQQQFWDNTVDAAEIARAEDGQAVYIIEVDESANGPLGWVRVRYKQPATGQVEMKTRVLAASLPAPEMDLATPAMKLAFSSASLAEKLAGNPYAAEVSLPYLEERMMEVSNVFSNDPVVPSLISMVRNARIQGL